MLQISNSRFLIQKICFITLILSFLSFLYMIFVVNPVNNLQFIILMNFILFVFFASMTYNLVEVYMAFIKKEILTIEQCITYIKISLTISINILGLLTLVHTKNFNLFNFILWIIITLTSLNYAKNY
jgi:hypothetical protein